MNTPSLWLTPRGLHKLEQEKLILNQRLNNAIMVVRETASSSANSFRETNFALHAKEIAQSRLQQIDMMLRKARVRQPSKSGRIGLGSKIYLQQDDELRKVTLVESIEADPLVGYVSLQSPLGKALIDKSVGDPVSFKTPLGTQKYKIVRIK